MNVISHWLLCVLSVRFMCVSVVCHFLLAHSLYLARHPLHYCHVLRSCSFSRSLLVSVDWNSFVGESRDTEIIIQRIKCKQKAWKMNTNANAITNSNFWQRHRKYVSFVANKLYNILKNGFALRISLRWLCVVCWARLSVPFICYFFEWTKKRSALCQSVFPFNHCRDICIVRSFSDLPEV